MTPWSDTELIVFVPAGISGSQPVTVTTPGGVSNPAPFTVTPAYRPETWDAQAGIDGHNCAAAIQSAFLAAHNAGGGTVLFTSGRTYYVSTSWNMPAIRTNDWYGATSPTVVRSGIITLSGYGATIKYAPDTTRMSWLQSYNGFQQYTTYGNLVIEGLYIDYNGHRPSANAGMVLWLPKNSVDNVTIRDVTTSSLPDRTTNSWNTTLQGVLMQPVPLSLDQAHPTYVSNINIEDCTIHAHTKSIAIVYDKDAIWGTAPSPVMMDNINIARCTINNHDTYGSCIHIGAYAAVDSCSVIDCDISHSCDNGIEIDAANDALVEGCTFHDLHSPVGVTWFCYPYLATTPNFVMRGCSFSGNCNASWAPDAVKGSIQSPRFDLPLPAAWKPDYQTLWTRSWGHWTFESCTFEFGVTNTYATHNYVLTSQAPMESVTITDCDITDVGSGGTLIRVAQNSSLGRTLPISIHDVRWRNTAGGAYALLPLSKCSFSGAYSLDTDMA